MLSLPPAIRAYFDANERLDTDAMLAPFADDAVVRDEGRTHRGTDAIRSWIEQTSIALPAIAVPRTIRSEDEFQHVTAHVSGTFPRSPVALSFTFRLKDGQIAELEIK